MAHFAISCVGANAYEGRVFLQSFLENFSTRYGVMDIGSVDGHSK